MSVTFNVRLATGPQLLAFFNENTGGAKVTKFRDRPTAEKRVQRLVDEMKAEEMIEDMGIKSQKEAAHIIANQLGASAALLDELGSEDPTDAEIAASNGPQPGEFIPSYNHTVCPKCGSSEIYNGRTNGGLVVDEDVIAGCHACDWVQDDRKRNVASVKKTPTGKSVEHDTVTKPWQRAKVIVCDMVSQGITSRKEIIAACVAAGIKYNTADGAHYSIVVQGRAK